MKDIPLLHVRTPELTKPSETRYAAMGTLSPGKQAHDAPKAITPQKSNSATEASYRETKEYLLNMGLRSEQVKFAPTIFHRK